MHVIVSHHDLKYQPLGDLTWEQNKKVYAERHGYAAHNRTENFVTGNGKVGMTGFEKIYLIKELFETHPEYQWAWYTGADSMITNLNVRIEDRIFDNYHFIVATDVNGINSDSFLIKNSPEGMELLNDILSVEEECLKFWDVEQRAVAMTLGLPLTGQHLWPERGTVQVCEKWADHVKIVPQKYFNSYIYQMYGGQYPDQRDRLGVDGNWSYGDWLVHWPGTSLEMRLGLATQFLNLVVK